MFCVQNSAGREAGCATKQGRLMRRSFLLNENSNARRISTSFRRRERYICKLDVPQDPSRQLDPEFKRHIEQALPLTSFPVISPAFAGASEPCRDVERYGKDDLGAGQELSISEGKAHDGIRNEDIGRVGLV
jgi:hypothetical protein